MVKFEKYLERMKKELGIHAIRGSSIKPLFFVEFLRDAPSRYSPMKWESPIAITSFNSGGMYASLEFHYVIGGGRLSNTSNEFRYMDTWQVHEIAKFNNSFNNLVIRIGRA